MKQESGNPRNSISTGEKAGRIYRDFNALGALVLAGAAMIAPPILAAPAAGLAGLNALQAGGGEWYRRYSKNKRINKNKDKK